MLKIDIIWLIKASKPINSYANRTDDKIKKKLTISKKITNPKFIILVTSYRIKLNSLKVIIKTYHLYSQLLQRKVLCLFVLK